MRFNNLILAVTLNLLFMGCSSTPTFEPISDKNPFNENLMKKTIEIQEDKIQDFTFYTPKRSSELNFLYKRVVILE